MAQTAVVLLEVDSGSFAVVVGEPSRVVLEDTTMLHTCLGVHSLRFELAVVPIVRMAVVVGQPLPVVEVVG